MLLGYNDVSVEIKDFIFFDPDWVDECRPKFKDFYVVPISNTQKYFGEDWCSSFSTILPSYNQTHIHTGIHTHENENTTCYLINNVQSARKSGSKKYSHLIKNQ